MSQTETDKPASNAPPCPRCGTVTFEAYIAPQEKGRRCPRCGLTARKHDPAFTKTEGESVSPLQDISFGDYVAGALRRYQADKMRLMALDEIVEAFREICSARGIAAEPFLLVAAAQVYVNQEVLPRD